MYLNEEARAGASTRRPAPWSFAAPWGGRGWLADLGGPVHWVEFEPEGDASRDAAPVVFVHGLGGSHLNWVPVGQTLAAGRRALALDLRGFGMTAGVRANSSVTANAALLDRFVREVVGEPVVLVGNSMGGMISIIQSARHPDTVLGTVLVDPALPTVHRQLDTGVALMFLVYGLPGFGELYLRRARTRTSPKEQVRQVVELCFADPSRACDQVLAAAEALTEARRGLPATEPAFLRAARSLIRLAGAPRTYRTMMRAMRCPVLLVHGELDRLVSVAAARKAASDNPSWRAHFLPGVGHTPQLEVPELFAELLTDWLAELPARAS